MVGQSFEGLFLFGRLGHFAFYLLRFAHMGGTYNGHARGICIGWRDGHLGTYLYTCVV